MAGKLTEEQRQEIVRRYEEGESSRQVAAAVGVGPSTVKKYAKEAGVLRSMSEGRIAVIGAEVKAISKTRWEELYCRPGCGYPSMTVLGDRFGCSAETIRAYLVRAGITPRSRSEQASIEIRAGRKPPPRGGCGSCLTRANAVELNSFQTPEIRRRAAAKVAAQLTTKRKVPCVWCGTQVVRQPARLVHASACCSRKCSGTWGRHSVLRPEEPRPLIVDRLRELLRQEPYKALPPTYETLEKAGATIGAGDPEIIEVLVEISR